jgi:hypothetical protein
MRRLAAFAVILALAPALPALAQQSAATLTGPDPEAGHVVMPGDNAGPPINGDPTNNTLTAPTGQQAPVSFRASDMPSNWTGSPADWTAHVQACKHAYTSYHVATDMFTVDGKSQHCMLAMNSAKPGAPITGG